MKKTEQTEIVEPLHDRVLVKRVSIPEGIIAVPEKYKPTSRFAKVLAVGPGAWRDGEFCKTVVKPGDFVFLPGIAATIPDWDDKDEILVQEGDIGGVIGGLVLA